MRHVTLRHLRTFTTALRVGSFSAAAEALHITPPAVTVQMRQLETIAGMPLIERTSDGVRATDAGREIAAAALRIETTLAECDDALASLRGLDSGRVAVGVVSTAKYFAPRALAATAAFMKLGQKGSAASGVLAAAALAVCCCTKAAVCCCCAKAVA